MTNAESKDSAPRAVAVNVADVLHDVTELAELQAKLLFADSKDTMRRALLAAVVMVVGLCLVLGCIPVTLSAIGYAVHQQTSMSIPLSLTVAAGGTLLLAVLLLVVGWLRLRRSFNTLDRSREELSRNVAWIKQSFKRKDHPPRHHCNGRN